MSRCIDPPCPPEPWASPELHRALADTPVLVVNGDAIRQEQIFLVRDSHEDTAATPCHAYQRIPHKEPIPLGEGGERGQVLFCVAYPSITQQGGELLFQEPPEDEAIVVAIKKIRKLIYRPQLQRFISVDESNENPYNEIAAMQYLNPEASVNQHPVMGCIEALEDDECIYIIMPYINGGELHHHIPWASRQRRDAGLPEAEARVVFGDILQCVEFLHQRGVCHRDLKNENIVMQSNNDGVAAAMMRPVPITDMSPTIIDMAMSLKVTSTDTEGQYYKLRAQGPCGTPPFMPPETAQNLDFDGYAVDVWSLGVMLFNLLTGQRLYHAPIAQDFMFKHFLLLGGLTDDELNETWQTRAANIVRRHRQHAASGRFSWLGSLLEQINVVQRLEPRARNLLQGMLHPDPALRLTLAQVRQHPWFPGN